MSSVSRVRLVVLSALPLVMIALAFVVGTSLSGARASDGYGVSAKSVVPVAETSAASGYGVDEVVTCGPAPTACSMAATPVADAADIITGSLPAE